MSADRYAVCPRCEHRRNEAIEANEHEVESSYGIWPDRA